MKSLTTLGLTILLAPIAALGQKVTTEFDESIDFAKYKTYTLRTGRIQSKHPALDNTLVEKKIQNEIRTRLSAKGLREIADRPDLLVRYSLGARDAKEIERVPAGWRLRRSRLAVHRYTQGTMVIDLLDGSNKELVWRAVCSDTASDPAKFEKRIDDQVKKAFEKFPPKKK